MRRLIALSCLSVFFTCSALPDTFSLELQAARAKINPIGDATIKSGPASYDAIEELLSYLEHCLPLSLCTEPSKRRTEAAVAAANLGWYYEQKGKPGDEYVFDRIHYYTQAAALGSPHGLNEVAKCLAQNCLTETQSEEVLAPLFSAYAIDNIFFEDHYRQSAIRELLGKASDLGFADATHALINAEIQKLGRMVSSDGSRPANTVAYADDQMRIIRDLTGTLKSQTNDATRLQFAESVRGFMVTEMRRRGQESGISPSVSQAKAYLNGLRARLKAAVEGGPPTSSTSVSKAPSTAEKQKSERYEKDLAFLTECFRNEIRLEAREDDLLAEKRSLERRQRELNQTRMTIENNMRPINPNDPNLAARRAVERAVWDAYHQDEDRLYADMDRFDNKLDQLNRDFSASGNRCNRSYAPGVLEAACQATGHKTQTCK